MIPYEVTYIITPTLEDDAVDALVERFSNLITGGGGELVKVEKAGKRKLAYELKGQREGHYIFSQFRAPKEIATELGRQLKLADEVLRSLIVRGN